MGLSQYLGFPRRKSRRPVAPHGAQLRGRRLGLEALEPRALLTALPTFTALGLSTSSATAGQPVTFTAQVSAPASTSAAPSGGSVTFTDDATVIGTAPLVNGKASLVNSLFTLGSQSIRASYSGNGDGLAGSLSAVASANITVASVAGVAATGYAILMHVAAPVVEHSPGEGLAVQAALQDGLPCSTIPRCRSSPSNPAATATASTSRRAASSCCSTRGSVEPRSSSEPIKTGRSKGFAEAAASFRPGDRAGRRGAGVSRRVLPDASRLSDD
jgi:hypothetical protein